MNRQIELPDYYIENNMNLPLINNRNIKPSTKPPHPLAQSAPSLEEFGLGIQVFKIQASKGLESNHGQPRKFIKNIENPHNRQPPQPIKRTQVLPSLSCEKREKPAFSETDFSQRRTAIQRKKPSAIVDTIKEVEEKQPIIKKVSNSAQKVPKNYPVDQPSKPQEPQIIQPHYRLSFNELTNFYSSLQESEAQNLKQIKRLRKMKDNADQGLLEKAMRLRTCKTQMIQEMVEKQEFGCFSSEQIYDEFSISAYMDCGECFRFEDEEAQLTDYDY